MSDEITKAGGSGDFNNFVRKLSDSNPESVPNCKLCGSKFRKEAEAKSDQKLSISSIHRWLESQGEEISYNAVANHINNHYVSKQDDANLAAYAERLTRWASAPKTDESFLRRYIEALDMEAMRLIAKNADLNITEQRKNDDMFVKLSAQLDAFRQQLRTLQGESSKAEQVVVSLNKIINYKRSTTQDMEVRKALDEVVEMLKKEMGAIDGGI
jgi:DNA repair exonuclease SbcCD ATPase subunit